MKSILLAVCLSFVCLQCKTIKPIVDSHSSRTFQDSLDFLIINDTLLNQHFVGFNLVDIQKNTSVCSKNKDLLFTPASNIKLLTYLTCLSILPDSISAFKYNIKNNTIEIAPNADPTFLNHNLDQQQKPFKYLKKLNLPIEIFINPKNKINRYGEGWAWDDNYYSFQTPLSVMPIYGNNISFSNTSDTSAIAVVPHHFKTLFVFDSLSTTFIRKNAFENQYIINHYKRPRRFDIKKPFLNDDLLLKKLLADTIQLKVQVINDTFDSKNWNIYKSVLSDSLYKAMLLDSDNFVAEQLLLMSSNEKFGYFDSKKIIQFALDSILPNSRNKIRWVDASGLSRYNLVSPSYITEILQSIYKKKPFEKIKGLFPSPESNGSMPKIFMQHKNWLYAKTGTLSNNFCLSGFIVSDSQKIYAFSFMNNHYVTDKKQIVEAIFNILNYIKKEG